MLPRQPRPPHDLRPLAPLVLIRLTALRRTHPPTRIVAVPTLTCPLAPPLRFPRPPAHLQTTKLALAALVRTYELQLHSSQVREGGGCSVLATPTV